MARYHQIAQQINAEVQKFAQRHNLTNGDVAQIGHIVNLAVRACPRACQHTVRQGIVQGAIDGFCRVTMLPGTDPVTGRRFNKIRITANGETMGIDEGNNDDGDSD